MAERKVITRSITIQPEHEAWMQTFMRRWNFSRSHLISIAIQSLIDHPERILSPADTTSSDTQTDAA